MPFSPIFSPSSYIFLLNPGFGELHSQQPLDSHSLTSSSFPPAASPWPPQDQSGAQQWGRMVALAPHCVLGEMRVKLGQGEMIQGAEHRQDSPRPPSGLERRKRSKRLRQSRTDQRHRERLTEDQHVTTSEDINLHQAGSLPTAALMGTWCLLISSRDGSSLVGQGSQFLPLLAHTAESSQLC